MFVNKNLRTNVGKKTKQIRQMVMLRTILVKKNKLFCGVHNFQAFRKSSTVIYKHLRTVFEIFFLCIYLVLHILLSYSLFIAKSALNLINYYVLALNLIIFHLSFLLKISPILLQNRFKINKVKRNN